MLIHRGKWSGKQQAMLNALHEHWNMHLVLFTKIFNSVSDMRSSRLKCHIDGKCNQDVIV